MFIAATTDHLFHAFDTKTGKLLWQTTLESGSYTTPMTYEAKNGKQYVVLVATGGSFFDMTAGDSVFAFALPGGLAAPKAMQSATNGAETPASEPQTAQTAAPAANSTAMPDGAGKAIAQKQCAVCHAVTVVTAKHASRSEWEQVVNQMVSRGADLSDDDIDTVLEYLTKNYGPLDQMTKPPAGADAPHQ